MVARQDNDPSLNKPASPFFQVGDRASFFCCIIDDFFVLLFCLVFWFFNAIFCLKQKVYLCLYH